jgi:phytoene dehydrogenase-like protein
MTEHDAVVIGAGHNGLVAANYLADAGLSVVLVEGSPEIGGMSSTAAMIPAAPQHAINHCAVDPIMWRAGPPGQELGLEEFGLRWTQVDPPFAYLDPSGGSIAFWHDPARTAEDIKRFSAADARAFVEFAEFLDAFYSVLEVALQSDPGRKDPRTAIKMARRVFKNRKRMGEIGAFALGSGKESIAERFEHPMVRNAMHVCCGATMPSYFPGSNIQFFLLAAVHRIPCWRPIGGTQGIPDALAARLGKRGGEVRTGSLVREIVVSGHRAAGVVLDDGTELRAKRCVVATCDPRQLFCDLVPSGTFAPDIERKARAIPTNGFGWGQMKIDIALSGRVDLSRHERERSDDLDLRIPSHWIGTEGGVERAFGASTGGLMPDADDLVLYNSVPTGPDPSQAPDGQDTLYVLSCAVPFAPRDGWQTIKDTAAKATISKVSEFYGPIESIEIGRQVHTHEDIAVLRHVSGGCHPHVDQILSRSGPMRPAQGLGGYRTPLKGLFLAGSGAHPGGAVTGLPGYHGARAAIKG